MVKIESKKTQIFIMFFLLLGPILFMQVNAQSIPITISSPMEEVKFDGKWSYTKEWKPSSLTEIKTDVGKIYLRSAHWQNYIYVMIDVVVDQTIDDKKDKAILCFDTHIDNSTMPNSNDFCFTVNL